MMQGHHRAVGKEDPSESQTIPGQPAWRRRNQIFEKTSPPPHFPPQRFPPVLSLVYTVTSAKHRRAGVATMRRIALHYDELRCERGGMIT